jgi:transcriptional repressor of cell division inhibition gene dicB
MTKEEAINWAGGVLELAQRLGITGPAVSQWDVIPPLRQYQLWTLSAGTLKLDEDLRKETEK